MTHILAIDASTEACSVALTNNDDIQLRHQVAPRQHCDLILPMVDELLKTSQLKLSELSMLAVTVGPGAFTGVRISLSVVQGLAYASDKPVIAVSTLEVLAYGAAIQYFADNKATHQQSVKVAVAIDARMDEVYWGCFQVSLHQIDALCSAGVFAPENIKQEILASTTTETDFDFNENWLFAGSGWSAYEQRLHHALDLLHTVQVSPILPQADWLAKIAQDRQKCAIDPKDIQPLYLRDKVAATIKERLSAQK